MQPTDPPVDGPQNNPMMPVAWAKTYKGARVFNTHDGSSQDLLNPGTRRMPGQRLLLGGRTREPH